VTDPEQVFDVCVVGAGPAGLAVVQSLIGTSRSVCLLEAGPSGDEAAELDDVELRAEDPYPQGHIRETRAAMVGGTAGRWSFRLVGTGEDPEPAPVGCRYLPLDRWDFEARPEIGTPGWPITAADLTPWYDAAQRMCGLGPFDYTPDAWADPERDCVPLPLAGTGVETSMFQFGPATAFTQDARARLEASPNIHLRTDTQALRLELDPAGERVIGVRVLGPDRQETVLRSHRVVLAAGTIENVRLILDTGRDGGRTPGDDTGLVGRYFMEHPLVRGGLLVTDPGAATIRHLGLYASRQVAGTWVSGKLTLSEEVLRSEGLPACSALLLPRSASFGTRGSQAVARLRSPSGRAAPVPERLRLALTALGDADSVMRSVRAARGVQPSLDRAGWGGPEADTSLTVFELLHQTEQAPDWDNRLELTPRRDAHGRSEVALDWRWSELDQDRVGRARDLFAAALEQAGMGTVVQRDWDRGRPRNLGGTHHHLGGLRMGSNPGEGVVDEHCRVHGTDNLFVAGASVFPSGGFANPTLTVVALALRLGAHLAAQPAQLSRSVSTT
jgi:choline dehydrogenase-like flavoprotein